MQPINALSHAPLVKAWLANSFHPRILHVFDQACNLINEHKEVLSIVTSPIGNGPFNLVLEEDICFSKYLSLQSPISVSPHQLHLGDLTIHTADAQLWSPRPDWERLHGRRDMIFGRLKSCLSSWKPAEADSATILTPKLPATDRQFCDALLPALVIADLPASISAAEQLAGLGIGLTPAGDDFILGAMHAAWIIHPLRIAQALADGITHTAAPLTTSLSAAWLRSAGKGEAGIMWHEFFDTLVEANTVQIQAAMHRILAVGETSGADALAGFMGTFISYAESKTSLCHS